ncbi:MAG: DUF3592 domain-containing protein [Anaerolineae bacterium]|nr:DUF3592 domain-containing protein [Anaerolineae bacterium]
MPESLSPMFHPNDFTPDDVPQASPEPAAETISIHELFVLNPAHRDFVLGRSRSLHAPLILGMGGCGVLFITPFVLAGLIMLGLSVHKWSNTIRLNTGGVTVQGQIVSLDVDYDSDGNSYYATYRFSPLDTRQSYTHRESISGGYYGKLSEGERVNVTYLRADPTLSRLADDAGSSMTQNILLSVFTIVWNLLIFGLVIGSIMAYRRSKRLEREGRLIKGTVVSCKGSSDSDGDYTIKLKYRFCSPTGRDVSKQESHIRNDLKGVLPPAPGTPVAVLYADDSCYQVI